MDRRAFLAGVVAAAAASGCRAGGNEGGDRAREPGGSSGTGSTRAGEGAGGAGTDASGADLPALPEGLPPSVFALGVASGDPLPDSVILWTRLVADPSMDGGGLPARPVPITWEVASDAEFADVVARGAVAAEPALAHAVHVDAHGLAPATSYWYRFTVGGRTSPVGRTRTAPAADAAVDRLRFAFASCQDRQAGYWTAHEHLVAEDLDAVVFLGDYIYEGPARDDAVRPARTPPPVELASYRLRHAEYRADPVLQAAHARFPWICTADDHEVVNNYAGLVGPRTDGGTEAFRRRRAAAYQAWYEHMPVRIDPPVDGAARIHRELAWGSLARMFVLDTRQHRSDQACGRSLDVGDVCAEVDDPERTMLGADQEAWLSDGLARSDATWNVLAQQVVMSRIAVGSGDEEVVNLDQWDGYPASRQRVVDMLREVANPVVITGDLHLSAVGVVSADPRDPSSDPVATELVGTSISSTLPRVVVEAAGLAVEAAPALRYVDARRRGYVVVEVTPEALRAEFRQVSTTAEPHAELTTAARWRIGAGNPVPERL